MLKTWGLIGISVILLNGCASLANKACDANIYDDNGRPCWVNRTPLEGTVVNMPKHAIPSKTRDTLFKTAVSELAVSTNGVGISQDSVVNKVTEVNNNQVAQHSSVTSFTVVSSANESVMVKAKVKDSWLDSTAQKMYLWVVLEGK